MNAWTRMNDLTKKTIALVLAIVTAFAFLISAASMITEQAYATQNGPAAQHVQVVETNEVENNWDDTTNRVRTVF